MTKQWVITKTQTGGEGLKTLTVEFLEKDTATPMTEAEYFPRKTVKFTCRNHVDTIKLNDILSMGLSGIEVVS